jgi:hypothetical protein
MPNRWLVYPSGSEPLDFYTTQGEAESAASALALADRGTTFLIDRAEIDTVAIFDTAETTTITNDPLNPDLMWIRGDGDSIDHVTGWTAVWDTGPEAYSFDAVYGQAIDAGTPGGLIEFTGRDTSVIGDAGDHTFTIWYHPSSPTSAAQSNVRWTGASNMWGFIVNTGTTNIQAFVYDTGAGAKGINETFDALDVWSFFAMSWDNTAEDGTFYIGTDGGTLTTIPFSDFGWTGPKRTSGVDELLFAGNISSRTRYDDFRYYGNVLTQVQINDIYVDGKAALGL